MSCSLPPDQLAERLKEWATVGRDGLISAEGRVLRFRPEPQLRAELERLVAAEADCCPTLELDLVDEPDALVLRVGG